MCKENFLKCTICEKINSEKTSHIKTKYTEEELENHIIYTSGVLTVTVYYCPVCGGELRGYEKIEIRNDQSNV